MPFNPEMSQWLSDNRDSYEFYLLHAILHDPLRRASLMSAPLIPEDFRKEEFGLVMGGMIKAVKVMQVIGGVVPAPPTAEWLRTYVETAANQEGAEEESIRAAMSVVASLQNPSFKEEHYTISPYFEAWYGGVRAKRSARRIQAADVPDVALELGQMQSDLANAAQAASTDEEDEMLMVIESEDMTVVQRRPTGIIGLDSCLNGGWGPQECYLLFSGTGGGKSIAAGQCALHEAISGGYPLILSTELSPREYVVRIVSAGASVSIDVIQDCENFAQIRAAVASSPKSMFRLKEVDRILQIVKDRIRIKKINADDGMSARSVMEREALRYENQIGKLPTWLCLDWLGSVADLGGQGGTSERAMAWEISANGCVQFAYNTGIPVLVLAQAVNDAQLKSTLGISDIGISKGIGKNMVAVIGLTNTLDKEGVKAALAGTADMPKKMTPDKQFFCVCKARKGEGDYVELTRNFRYQRFEVVAKRSAV